MDSIGNMWSGNKRLSLRRSIVGSIKRSLSPLSKNSDSPTASQTSCASIELAQENSSSQKDQVTPTPVQSLSNRFKKPNSPYRNRDVAIELGEDEYSQKAQLSSDNVQTGNSRTSKSSSVSPQNRVSMQSIHDIPSRKKTPPTRTASTASKLGQSLSTSFFADNTHPIQALKDVPVQENQQLLPGQTKSSASTHLPKKLYPTLIPPNNRSSIQSIQELPSQEKDVSLPARSSSTSGRYSTVVWPPSQNNQTTPKSEQSTSATKRSSIVSFQIPEVVQVKSPQSDALFTAQAPSNASKSNRSSWFSVSRTSSTKSRKQSQLAKLQRMGLGGGKESSVSQRQYDNSTAKETTLPWDPPFNRDWDVIACDGIRSDPNRVFENCLPPQRNNNSSLMFNMPIKVRRKVYSYCLPKRQNITVSLSPHFATKNCYYGYHFTSPWDILQPVAGGLQSFSLMRDDLMTYFWTEYDFHVTLTPFCNSVFTPLSSVWLPNFLDRIQHLTIEIDLTRFGGNALKFARSFGYDMEKMDNIFCAVINGLVERRGEMAELVVLCRRFDGNRRFDENDSTWKAGESFEYFPEESMQFCDAIINLRGTVKSIRIAGFPIDVTKDWLNCIFADGEESCQMTTPNVSAWPPLPPLFSGLRQAPTLYAAPMAPVSPELSNYRESHKTQWQYEASVYSVERPEDNDESPVRPDTSLSVTTVGDPVKLYQELLPAITLSDTFHRSVEPLSDSTKTPTKTAALTYQVMAAEDRNNSKRHIKKPNPRNSRDFSPGQFYYQPIDVSESEMISQGQKSDPETMNQIRQSPVNNWNGQKANRAEIHRTSSSEKDNSLPKTPISMSKRKSQFSERQMPDIPESPLNPNRTKNLHTEAPVIRSGTLKATSDAHLLRIRSHISKSVSNESFDEHPSLPTPSQTFKPETSESINDRTIICTPSRKSESKVSKDRRGDPSPTRPFQQAVNHDIQHFADDNSIDRRLPRTPSPKARSKAVLVTSPETLNKINEQDPKFLKSIRALQSACTSTESVIGAPDQTYRRTSLASPLIHSDTRPKRSETDQSANSGESDLKRSKFAAWFRRSN
ncbi:hypothetical protein DSL72_001745 [Monilinia vaccinii-corymbosi]|uniref:Uncharacterized protein n=1 Tax=Monilinia vaccinii-corymbosi TaxID=61207 RepID=A0A8A3PAP8_9HELO|nr:hypothetical protein DSL72_001745 [Monilinia vaccinii-corymbosi]